jgi:protein subunit release factor A
MWLSKPFERSLKEADANTAQLNHFEYLRNCFFGSKVENIIANYKDYEISDDQVKKLKELYEYFKNYQEKDRDKHDYKKILDDSEWDHIQNLAKEVVALFNYKQFPDEDNIVSEA